MGLVTSFKKRVFGPDPRPALLDLDRKLSKYLNFRKGFFIEAGANDGYTQSNTYFLERVLGWNGVLVEAIPELYAKCVRTRRRARVFNSALVAPSYCQSTVRMHFADLMSVTDGAMKSADAQDKHIKAGMACQSIRETYSVEVPARTLESILDEARAPAEIDFMSLDVEGYELQVLEGLNIARYRPKFMLVEARFFDEVKSYLMSRYEVAEKLTHHDYLFRRK